MVEGWIIADVKRELKKLGLPVSGTYYRCVRRLEEAKNNE